MVSSDGLEMRIFCEMYTRRSKSPKRTIEFRLATRRYVGFGQQMKTRGHGHREEWQTSSSCLSHVQWHRPIALLQLEDESLAICLDQEESWSK